MTTSNFDRVDKLISDVASVFPDSPANSLIKYLMTEPREKIDAKKIAEEFKTVDINYTEKDCCALYVALMRYLDQKVMDALFARGAIASKKTSGVFQGKFLQEVLFMRDVPVDEKAKEGVRFYQRVGKNDATLKLSAES